MDKRTADELRATARGMREEAGNMRNRAKAARNNAATETQRAREIDLHADAKLWAADEIDAMLAVALAGGAA